MSQNLYVHSPTEGHVGYFLLFLEHIYNSCFEVFSISNIWVHFETDSIDCFFPCFSTKNALEVTLYLYISVVSQWLVRVVLKHLQPERLLPSADVLTHGSVSSLTHPAVFKPTPALTLPQVLLGLPSTWMRPPVKPGLHRDLLKSLRGSLMSRIFLFNACPTASGQKSWRHSLLASALVFCPPLQIRSMASGIKVLSMASPALGELLCQGMRKVSNPRQGYNQFPLFLLKGQQLFMNKWFSNCCFSFGQFPEP